MNDSGSGPLDKPWRDGIALPIYIVAFALYWILRVAYFRTHTEQIFSDIEVYVRIADAIVNHFSFGFDKYYAFFSPGTPAAIAISKVIAGSHFQKFYPFFIASINCAGVALLARELGILVGRAWLGALFMLVVALLKPSIFWQLKLSTEGLAEALMHSSLALVLMATRIRSMLLAFAGGIVYAWLFLTRPQYLLCLPVLALYFALQAPPPTSTAQNGLRVRLALGAAFAAGLMLLWTPWIYRNYQHYGRLVPVSLAGSQTMIWEYGLAPIRIGRYTEIRKDDGQVIPLGLDNALRFDVNASSDIAFYDHLRELYGKWLKLNYRDMWVPILTRTTNVIAARDAGGLTTLSREELFPWTFRKFNNPHVGNSPLNLILVDKTAPMVLLGLAGMALLQWRRRRAALPITAFVLLMWAVPAVTLGFPRVVDAQIAVTLWAGLWLMTCVVLRAESRAVRVSS